LGEYWQSESVTELKTGGAHMVGRSLENYVVEFKAFLETPKGKEISAGRDVNQRFFQQDLRA
jgi:hypothetical protein